MYILPELGLVCFSYHIVKSITTLVVIFSAPMPKSPGGLVVRASS